MATKRTTRTTSKRRSADDELPAQWQAFSMTNEEVERHLHTGDFAGTLEDYFGSEQYNELRRLAQEAQSSRSRGAGPRVLILPGILGSTIGSTRPGPIPDDVYWLDPIDVIRGYLADMRLLPAEPKKLVALGVILFAYLKLKLHLSLAGYDADFFPFDWRKPIRSSAEALLEQLKKEKASEVNLVAHSMGGLVARMAMSIGGSSADKKIRRLIMLGTPNHGSFAPVQAIRGTYGTVRSVAALDRVHRPNPAEWLSANVFNTFPGLYQMLPDRTVFSNVDLYDATKWPATKDRPAPRQKLLDDVDAAQKLFAPGNAKMTLIAGINMQTTVDLRVQDQALQYGLSLAGDGTVPLDYARLTGIAETYYVEEKHGSLPNNTLVARSVADILDSGSTKRLPTDWQPPQTSVEWHGEMDVRAAAFEEAETASPSQRQVRESIADFAAPTARDAGPLPITTGPVAVISPDAGYEHTFQHVVVGRRWQRRLEVRLARGSVTEVDARAIVIGVFQDVSPTTGPARALDERMNGLITDISLRRMFTGRVGEVFMMPVGRNSIRADLIAFAGLGAFDRFNREVQQTVAENVIRAFMRANVEEFATVLFGAGSGGGAAKSLQNLLVGFLRGLNDADGDQRFRRLILCEYDNTAYQQMKEEFFRLASTDICSQLEITFDEEVLLAPPSPGMRGGAVVAPPEDGTYTYLVVRNENTGASAAGNATRVVRSSLLTAGGKASVISGTVPYDAKQITAIQQKVTAQSSAANFTAIGTEIAATLLPETVRTVLSRSREHLVVVHDAETSRLPWELLCLGDWFPAADKGLSHRYTADDLSIARYLEVRRRDKVLQVLLIADPTENLPGAEKEGAMVLGLFKARPDVQVEKLWQREATKPAVLAALRSGRFDVVHYAGHAFFDPVTPSNSGILCSGNAVLSGSDLTTIGNLPALVFFNACEAARVRAVETKILPEAKTLQKKMQEATGLAESFLRGGVANYLGTFWPVGDDAAKEFAQTFYSALLDGKTIRAAVQAGRTAVRDLKDWRSRDWADYIHYGDPGFVLKNIAGGDGT